MLRSAAAASRCDSLQGLLAPPFAHQHVWVSSPASRCFVGTHTLQTAYACTLDTTRLVKFSHHTVASPAASLPLPAPPRPFYFVLLPYTAVLTAEEFALHRMVEMAEEFMQDGSSAVEDEIERLQLPRSTLDEDFARVSDAAFQDHDVLMLFDMPHVSQQYHD
jgi:hypothetical protein